MASRLSLLATSSSSLFVASAALDNSYILQESYSGESFFDKFDFFAKDDPSKGVARYVTREEATSATLLRSSEGEVILGADRIGIQDAADVRSVRIQSRRTYNSGIFIARVKHMPAGCGQWPALWLYGENPSHPWPSMGEYDIIEGVNEQTEVMTTLHTRQGCSQLQVQAGTHFSGSWVPGGAAPIANDCYVGAEGQFQNQGCSQKGPAGSFGAGFNAWGGGIYAAEWDPQEHSIRTWFWPRGYEPADLQFGSSTGPLPDTWGQPYSYFSLGAPTCSPDHFKNMRLVINLDFCGDLTEGLWESTCPTQAAVSTCQEFVKSHPDALNEAYWSFEGIEVYQRRGSSSFGVASRFKAFFITLGIIISVIGLALCLVLLTLERLHHNQRTIQHAKDVEEMEEVERAHQEQMLSQQQQQSDLNSCSFTGSVFWEVFSRVFGGRGNGRRDAHGGHAQMHVVQQTSRIRSSSADSVGSAFPLQPAAHRDPDGRDRNPSMCVVADM